MAWIIIKSAGDDFSFTHILVDDENVGHSYQMAQDMAKEVTEAMKLKLLKKNKVSDYANQVLEKVSQNHLWLNAFSCINPSNDFKRSIGEWVLSQIKVPENLLPSSGITDKNKTIRELAELTPVLYVSINKS